MDLDLAVSHPESEFSSAYKQSFDAKVQCARAALHAHGLVLPEGSPLPARFPFRISVGSYSSAGKFFGHLYAFVDHLLRYHMLPWSIPPETPPAGASLPAVLTPLRWKSHLAFALGQLFVPVELDEPLEMHHGPERFSVASSRRALAILELLDELTHLHEYNFWSYQDLLPTSAGEPFPGYAFVERGCPQFPELWALQRLREATRRSVEHSVCFTVS